MPDGTQVVYVTHSPAMIDPFNLEQVRQVELQKDSHGTRVSGLAVKNGPEFDLLEPVRSAIGATVATSLLFNELNVLVEGAADKPILEGAFEALCKGTAERLVINGSVAENNGLLPQFYYRSRLPFVVFVDADAAGRKIANAIGNWGVPADRLIDLAALFPGRQDFELEDIVGREFYHGAVLEAYPELEEDSPAAGFTGKRTRHYERVLREKRGIGFNKRRVGEIVKRLLIEGAADAETSANLITITSEVLKALNRQVGGEGPYAATV